MAVNTEARGKHYRAVWRWHFFSGLIIAPFLMTLAITGALYLFDREINAWLNDDVIRVSATGAPATLTQQESLLRQRYPTARFRTAVLPHDATQAYVWKIIASTGEAKEVYIDPYRLTITGERDPDMQLMNIVRELHGELLMGDTGSYVVELTACWTLIMLVTGAYLWWPQSWRSSGIFSPRLSASGKPFWRDLHAIPAFYNLLFAAFLILSGLPWSVFWGEQLAKLGQTYAWIAPSPNFHSAPSLTPTISDDPHAQHRAETTEPWVIQHAEKPAIARITVPNIAVVEPWLSTLPVAQFGPGIRVMYPANETGVFTISYVPDKAEGQQTIYVHPEKGNVIDTIAWDRYSGGGKVIEWGVMTHMGRQYGLLNQLAGLLVCLILVLGTIVGLYLSWTRNPNKRLEAPTRRETDRLPRWMTTLMVVLGIVFPLLGVTLLAAWLTIQVRRRLTAHKT